MQPEVHLETICEVLNRTQFAAFRAELALAGILFLFFLFSLARAGSSEARRSVVRVYFIWLLVIAVLSGALYVLLYLLRISISECNLS